MEEKRIVDYFVVAGLPENPTPLDEFSNEASLKPTHKQDPIVDIAVIITSMGETPPAKHKCVELTPTGLPADLNHGSIRAPEVHLCYRRGRDKPPLTDIGVLYEGKERVMQGCEVVHTSPYGRPANVNNSNSSRTYITYRRADEAAASDTLAVTDVCIILANKGETAPHAFCQIGKNLNKGMVGSDVFLCYKKSMAKANTIAYKPATLFRWPQEDYSNFEFPESVPMFCLPLGASIESWPAKAQHPLPVFSTFVLTGGVGEKVYGAAIMFYEEYPREKLTDGQKTALGITIDEAEPDSVEKTIHHNKCICVLSRWPFFDAFHKFLQYLYRISISGSHSVPIERHISHFMLEVPFPSPQRPRILVQLAHDSICISRPEETPLQESGASFTLLLKNLGPENCLSLLLFGLMEHKILIHSLRPAVLTSVAEALTNMIFPFHWQCPYIPLCPLGLSEVLNAPFPFIVGVDSRYFDLYDPPPDVTCIDLDTNTTSISEERKGTHPKMLPKKPAKVLRATLDRLFDQLCQEPSNPGTPVEVGMDMAPLDHDFKRRRNELLMETAIREAFLRFMACCLKGYNQYLLPITAAPTTGTTDVSSLFDVSSFLRSRDKTYHKFFMKLMSTQLFSRFIEERSFVSDKDASLAFFDECTEKVEDYRDEPRLIELDDTTKSERTVFIMPPEPVGLPLGAVYSYSGFPILNQDMFLPRPRPLLTTPMKSSACPSSPMTRRTKQEVRSAQKIAQKHAGTPVLWAKCLLGHCYSLWFIHLPAYVKSVHSKTKALRTAFEVLVKMQNAKLQPPDEVCYRVLMQLCGLYHQPVLAVKVLFEMKRNGVHPNAITYGFYNKAVLESKWPSSDTNAYLLWTKLRNVIMAVAQFRKALRRRRLSVYSTSESDFDRISRTSTDSFVDEIQPLDKLDAAKVTEFVNDLVSVESPNMEERTSTGGMSDRGYSSMTLEDAKRVSLVMGSQESIESLTKLIARNGVSDRPRPIAKITAANRKYMTRKKERQSSKEVAVPFAIIDPKTDEAFHQRVGSIVRKSAGSAGSGSTLHSGSTLGSSAGLLMTSQTSIDEALFAEFGLSHSLNFRAAHSSSELKRKRHKSAGDHVRRRRALSLQDEVLPEGQQDSRGEVVVEKTKASGDSELTPCTTTTAALPGLAAGEVLEGVDNRVSGERVNEVERTVTEDNPRSVTCVSSNSSTDPPCVRTTETGDTVPPDIGQEMTQTPGEVRENGDVSSDTLKSEQLLDLDSSKLDCSTANSTVVSSVFNDYDDKQTPTSSKTSTPSHSARTPVTENDPLGLFSAEQQFQSTPPDPSTVTTVSRLGSLSKDTNDSGVSSNMTQSSANRSNLLIDFEPFSTPKKMPAPTFLVGSSPNRPSPTKARLVKSASMTSSDASSASSPAEEWAPLSQSQSQTQVGGPETSTPSTPTSDNMKTVRTPDNTGHQLDRTPSFETPTSESRRGKAVGRSDSFGFSNALRSAASLFSTKFNEIKQSMTPVKGEQLTSQTSLPKPHEMEKLLYEAEEDMLLRKAGSLDHLGRSGTAPSSAEDRADGTSLDGHLDGTPRMRQQNRYTPFVEGFWESLQSLQTPLLQGLSGLSGLPALQGLAHSIESLKGARSEDSLDSKSTPTSPDKGSAPPHSTLDQYFPLQDIDLGVASAVQSKTVGSAANPGSVNSIPQALFNMAMEVEMCSLSRCTSCLSLLYDEEIMAGWSADDSNLNTTCQFCSSKLVPLLQIQVKDFRQSSRPTTLTPSQSSESMQSIQSVPTVGHPATRDQRLTALAATAVNQSLTSLTSTDSAPMEVIEEIKVNGNNNEELGTNSIEEAENESTAESSPKDIVTSVVTEAKLIEFSPTSTPSHQSKLQPDLPASNGNKPESPERKKSVGECSTSNEKDGQKKNQEADDVSQTSNVEDEDGTASVTSTKDEVDRKKSVNLEPMTVPYLSPLVLRKEVENVLEQEGDLCLSRPQFVDEHPIIFWNLVWYFRRLDVPSHLPGFILSAASTNYTDNKPPKSWSSADSRHVAIRPVWDNLRMHEELGPPMYVLWNNTPYQSATLNALITESQTMPRSVMQRIVSSIMCNDVVTPIRLIMSERHKQKFVKGKPRFRSIYRDILFLAFIALGRENIDHDAFEREYVQAFSQLNPRDLIKMRTYDRPPNRAVHCCRKVFSELEL